MNTETTIKYGEHSVDISKLPAVSLHRLASYGFAHYLGNQASSKVTAWSDKEENKGATDEQKAAQKATFQTTMLAALMDGTIGQHASRGPAVDPIEVEMDRIAKAEVIKTLKANSIKVPKKDEAVQFESGESLSMEALIERRLAKHGDRIRKEGEAVLKEKARKVKKLAENAAAGVADLL